jgi:hypothetical protein
MRACGLPRLSRVWPNETELTGPAADGRQIEGPYRRVRLNAWLGRTLPIALAHTNDSNDDTDDRRPEREEEQ